MIVRTTMYCSNLPRAIFGNNLHPVFQSKYYVVNKGLFYGETVNAGFLKFYSLFSKNVIASRSISFRNNCHNITYGSKFFTESFTFLRFIIRGFQRFPQSLKEQSVHIVRVCTQQCECVLAHRIRRGQQIFSLYSKLWDEVALKELMRKMRQQLSKRGKEFLLGAVGVAAYNWDKERIPDAELYGQIYEMQQVYELRESTVTCFECRKRMVIDAPLSNIDYCSCSTDPPHCLHKSLDGWQPFLEREDLLVWRKECEQSQGMYVYKVYGSYEEVIAADFLQVQIDTEFRMVWDNTAINLKVVEKDSKSNSDIVYWEMEWPRLFSNRDYVFNRRYLIDEKRNVIVIINKGTSHPGVPVKAENHRVTDYWSVMVIKAYNDLNKPGMEFSLTYFDNPGVSIPSAITAWVALSGLPDFQVRLRQAARDYKSFNDKRQLRDYHKEDSGPKFHTDPSPSKDERGPQGDLDMPPTVSPSETPPQDCSYQAQDHHSMNSSSSRMYLKQFHAWQLFL